MSVSLRSTDRPRVKRQIPAAFLENQWKKGQSGNPGGIGGDYHECMSICRQATPKAARRLGELISSDDERVALMAADKVDERAWGRPNDYDPKSEVDPNRPRFDPTSLSPDQLELVEHALRLMVRATRPPSE